MEKQSRYVRTEFAASVLKHASETLRCIAKAECECPERRLSRMSVEVAGDVWDHDSEAEFFADCGQSMANVAFVDQWTCDNSVVAGLHYFVAGHDACVYISAARRDLVQRISNVFENHASESRLPTPMPVVFVGHGRSGLWLKLKDHLQDKHGIEVEAYEVGARAGHAVRDVLERMLKKSTMAFLVMSRDDQTSIGDFRARQNVVHEVGLFQGRIGFDRTIMLVEAGVELFSNAEGIQQIRFPKAQIESTFGEVVATIRREHDLT